jgi:hypothetical protein
VRDRISSAPAALAARASAILKPNFRYSVACRICETNRAELCAMIAAALPSLEATPTRDHLTADGAHLLADRIEVSPYF